MSEHREHHDATDAADAPHEELAAVLARHEIDIPSDQSALLRRYCELLWEWNTKLNLTRHTTYEKFVGRDLVDTLELAKLLAPGERVLDVGTGGGVPGVPLRILRDDLDVSLLDSVGKKARAVTDIVQRLGLPIAVYNERLQEHLAAHRYDTLIVRAVARLAKLVEWVRPNWSAFDRMLIVKGPAWIEERGEARHRGVMHEVLLRRVASYPLRGADSESVILQLTHEKGP